MVVQEPEKGSSVSNVAPQGRLNAVVPVSEADSNHSRHGLTKLRTSNWLPSTPTSRPLDTVAAHPLAPRSLGQRCLRLFFSAVGIRSAATQARSGRRDLRSSPRTMGFRPRQAAPDVSGDSAYGRSMSPSGWSNRGGSDAPESK